MYRDFKGSVRSRPESSASSRTCFSTALEVTASTGTPVHQIWGRLHRICSPSGSVALKAISGTGPYVTDVGRPFHFGDDMIKFPVPVGVRTLLHRTNANETGSLTNIKWAVPSKIGTLVNVCL